MKLTSRIIKKVITKYLDYASVKNMMRARDIFSWQIFIVTHEQILDEFLFCDKTFNFSRFTIVNISNIPLTSVNPLLKIVNLKSVKNFRPLESQWSESEAIFNLYLADLTKSYDYVGFLQYDKPLRPRRLWQRLWWAKSGFTEQVNRKVSSGLPLHLSFETHTFKSDFNQRIMADFDNPRTLTGNGKNCYFKILEDYNLYFSKDMSIEDLRQASKINLCSSFLIDLNTFSEMMSFFAWVYEERNLNLLDPERIHRLQGGLAERYFAVFLALSSKINLVDMSIPHVRVPPLSIRE